MCSNTPHDLVTGGALRLMHKGVFPVHTGAHNARKLLKNQEVEQSRRGVFEWDYPVVSMD